MITADHFSFSPNISLGKLHEDIPSLTRCSSPSDSSASSSFSAQSQTGKKKTRSRPSKVKTPLPLDFQPSEYTVLCGRSRECFESVGNRRFRILCNSYMQEYMGAPGKLQKSRIVTRIMKAIRQACPVGAFVSYENGRWYEVSQRTAREKVGGYFRDSLPTVYRSSAKAKQARKRAESEQKPQPSTSVDIIDMSLLDCIAPVDMDDLDDGKHNFFGASFWDLNCAQAAV